ncbi:MULTISPECIES: hypothetical protein [Streptomyces]|uniref:Uncharacterized protein n=1 Tax=Streptomyces griseiscabiei TaxID=2993540 RepID=A0ABU4LIQ6_9ACTN|nr:MULTISPECIES: hypothetical protein [Streptomyces]MBZ3908283.1 hypothetical protein [Streptomyces griseiscabiei]MDX2915695.1 hypothetical protein [Streptomyces griseiscabiei]
MRDQDLTNAEIERRMADAAQAEEEGRFRDASGLYDQLGKDIQAHHGRFDARALDAFEGVARAIRKGAEDPAVG